MPHTTMTWQLQNRVYLDLILASVKCPKTCACSRCLDLSLWKLVYRVCSKTNFPVIPFCQVKPGDFIMSWIHSDRGFQGLQFHNDDSMEQIQRCVSNNTRRMENEAHSVRYDIRTLVVNRRASDIRVRLVERSYMGKCQHDTLNGAYIIPLEMVKEAFFFEMKKKRIGRLLDRNWESIQDRLWRPGGPMCRRNYEAIEALLQKA